MIQLLTIAELQTPVDARVHRRDEPSRREKPRRNPRGFSQISRIYMAVSTFHP